MATINCLACGHENRGGEETCAACCASLRLKLCLNCEAINPEGAQRCHNCSTERSRPLAWLFSAEPSPQRPSLRAALLAAPVVAVAAFTAYHLSEGVPEARAVTVTAPKPREPQPSAEPPKAPPASRDIPRVTHTRLDSASSGGGTGPSAQ